MNPALVITTLLLLAGIAAMAVWLARSLRRELGSLRFQTAAELTQRNADVDRRLVDLATAVDRRLEGLDSRLLATQRSTGETTTQIVEKLSELGGTASQMLARANDLARLEQALRPPKARGGFGELLLENLLRDRLPPGSYERQYGFSTGERVDAVVRAGRLIPVDSKFTFDNFHRLAEAASDDERQLHAKAFARDVKAKVDEIAGKYIRPEEGTYDFAFMYVPVESVYYEITCGPSGDVLEYALGRRVFPVSPTTFTAYLQVVVLGLRGLQVEEHAQEVMAYVADLGKEFARFKDDFDLVGSHLSHAQKKFAEADKRLDRFETKLERASDDRVIELQAVDPPAIEAA
jgi:DNA recombination protein RmuC